MRRWLFVMVVLFSACGPTGRAGPTPPAVGQEAHLWASDGSDVYLAGTEVWQDYYDKALAANDQVGVQELIRRERIFPVANGTRVLVLEHYREITKVRVLEGQQTQKAGWTAAAHVR